MLQFCQYLHDDINQNLNEWVSFMDYEDVDTAKRTEALTQKLAYLKKLISERKEWFGKDHCFL